MNSGCLSTLVVLIFGTGYLAIAFSGLENQFSLVWAGTALIILIVFNITLPLSVGSYFYATSVLGWHWFEAILFSLIVITIIVPLITRAVNRTLNPPLPTNRNMPH